MQSAPLRLGIFFIRGMEAAVGAGEMQTKGVSPVASSHLVNCRLAHIVIRCFNSWEDFRILFSSFSLPFPASSLLSLGGPELLATLPPR